MEDFKSSLIEPEKRSGYNDFRYEKDNGLIEMFFTWHKRLNRLRYFKRLLLLIVIETILAFAIVVATMEPAGNDVSTTCYVFVTLAMIAFVPSHYMLIIRRLHDLNLTGWLCLLIIVPGVNVFFSLYLLFAPGTIGANDYGADPIECVD